MKAKGLAFIVLALILAMFLVPKMGKEKKHPVAIEDSSYFVPVPIVGFSSIQVPCLNVCVSGKNLLAELDLGLRGDIAVTSQFLEQIEDKSFVGTRSMWGWRGNEYVENVYEIPQVKIGKLTISRLLLQEEGSTFRKDSTLFYREKDASVLPAGRLGWRLFTKTTLLLDLGKSLIAFCDSAGTMKQQGYDLVAFAKVPFTLDQGLIEFVAAAPEGPLRCFLDTGSTWNILHTESVENATMEEMASDPKNISEYSSFKIGGEDLGRIVYHRLPIKLPVPVEFTLGMEFFMQHTVFIDFNNHELYISLGN